MDPYIKAELGSGVRKFKTFQEYFENEVVVLQKEIDEAQKSVGGSGSLKLITSSSTSSQDPSDIVLGGHSPASRASLAGRSSRSVRVGRSRADRQAIISQTAIY